MYNNPMDMNKFDRAVTEAREEDRIADMEHAVKACAIDDLRNGAYIKDILKDADIELPDITDEMGDDEVVEAYIPAAEAALGAYYKLGDKMPKASDDRRKFLDFAMNIMHAHPILDEPCSGIADFIRCFYAAYLPPFHERFTLAGMNRPLTHEEYDDARKQDAGNGEAFLWKEIEDPGHR